MDWRSSFLCGSSPYSQAAPSPNEAIPLPDGHEVFGTGTGVLLALGRLLRDAGKGRRRLYVPSFFCIDVVRNLKTVFDICWYRDLPTEPNPDVETIIPDDGDVVLAANTFCIRDGAIWRDWRRRHDQVMLLEDHSHDPFSPWAATSQAHYSMASLRKTLPLPDGALIWSPEGLEVPRPYPSPLPGAGIKLAGMILKHAYLKGASFPKDKFRRMEVESEEEFSRDTGHAASPFTSGMLGVLRINDYRQRRMANFKKFKRLADERDHPHWTLLFESWPDGAAPFGIILLCQDNRTRDALRQHLITRNIFAAVHWAQSHEGDVISGDELAINLAGRVLTIPCDQRYDEADMARLFECVSSYSG